MKVFARGEDELSLQQIREIIHSHIIMEAGEFILMMTYALDI